VKEVFECSCKGKSRDLRIIRRRCTAASAGKHPWAQPSLRGDHPTSPQLSAPLPKAKRPADPTGDDVAEGGQARSRRVKPRRGSQAREMDLLPMEVPGEMDEVAYENGEAGESEARLELGVSTVAMYKDPRDDEDEDEDGEEEMEGGGYNSDEETSEEEEGGVPGVSRRRRLKLLAEAGILVALGDGWEWVVCEECKRIWNPGT